MFRISELRKAKGISMRQASIELGIPYTTYVSYEKGEREPNSEMLVKLSEYFNCTIDYLIGRCDIKNIEEFHNTPGPFPPSNMVPMSQFKWGKLAGEIACGCPRNAEYDEDVMLPVGADAALYCVGDSMINIGLSDGDIVYIRYVTNFEEVRNGEIAAVGIGGDYEYTLKRWYFYPEKAMLKLVPENDDFKVMTFEGEELEEIHLLGVAVGFTALF